MPPDRFARPFHSRDCDSTLRSFSLLCFCLLVILTSSASFVAFCTKDVLKTGVGQQLLKAETEQKSKC